MCQCVCVSKHKPYRSTTVVLRLPIGIEYQSLFRFCKHFSGFERVHRKLHHLEILEKVKLSFAAFPDNPVREEKLSMIYRANQRNTKIRQRKHEMELRAM